MGGCHSNNHAYLGTAASNYIKDSQNNGIAYQQNVHKLGFNFPLHRESVFQ